MRQLQRGSAIVNAKREAEEVANFAHEETMRLGAAFQDALAHHTPEEYTEEHRAMIVEFVAVGRSARQTRARLEKATEDFEHVQLLRNIFAYLELAATVDYSTYIYYIEETEDYGDYEAVKAAYIPRILEVVELMEANDADVPFEGTLDAVGLLDGLLEQAMEGLNLLGGE